MTTTTMNTPVKSQVKNEETKREERRLANRNTVRKFRFREKIILEQLRRSVNGLTKKNATLRQDNKVCKSAISHIKNMLSASANNASGALRSVPPFSTASSIIEDPKIAASEACQQQQSCLPPLCSTSVASLLSRESQQEQLLSVLLQRQQQQQTMMAEPSGFCVADLLKLRQLKSQENPNHAENLSAMVHALVQQRQQQMLQSYMQQNETEEILEQRQQVQPNLSSIRAMLNLF